MVASNLSLAEKLREMEKEYNKPAGTYYQQLSQPSAWQNQSAYNRFLSDAKKTGYGGTTTPAATTATRPQPTTAANQTIANLTGRTANYGGYQPYQPNPQI